MSTRADAQLDRVEQRWLSAAVSSAAVLPIMLGAHWATARQLPQPGVIALVALVAFATLALWPVAQGRSVLALFAAQLLGQGVLLLSAAGSAASACLPVIGRGADVGLRLALFRPDAACRQGTLAASPALVICLTLIASAVGVVLAHVLAAVLAARGSGAILTLLRLASTLWARLMRALTPAFANLSGARLGSPALGSPVFAASVALERPHLRGPPPAM